MTAYLNRIGLAVPAHDVHDAFVRFATTLLPDERRQAVFRRMVGRCGIEHRFSSLQAADDPAGASVDPRGINQRRGFPSTGPRLRRNQEAALALALDAVGRLGVGAVAVTHLIVTSCTGFYAPGLDLELARALALAPSVERTIVGFMGCQAAFNALKLARHVVRSDPDAAVLMVNLEMCTLHLQESDSLEQVLSFLVFADGCAASLISASPEGLALDRFRTELVPGTEGLITWRIADLGFDMFLSGRVPAAIADGLQRAAPAILDGARPGEIDVWAVHPGGRSVLDAVEGALGLPDAALDLSRRVLRDYGNMSSATIMFVLAALMREPERGQRGCALGFGPGLVAESLLFHTA